MIPSFFRLHNISATASKYWNTLTRPHLASYRLKTEYIRLTSATVPNIKQHTQELAMIDDEDCILPDEIPQDLKTLNCIMFQSHHDYDERTKKYTSHRTLYNVKRLDTSKVDPDLIGLKMINTILYGVHLEYGGPMPSYFDARFRYASSGKKCIEYLYYHTDDQVLIDTIDYLQSQGLDNTKYDSNLIGQNNDEE